MQSLLQAARDRQARMRREGESLHAMLSQLTLVAEAVSGDGSVASILVIDKDGLLRNGASPNLPADYLDAIDRLKPDAGVGTCAAAAASGEPVMTPSFYDDRRWSELRQLPLSIGFVGAWSMPIKSTTGHVVGTFGQYFREARLPSADERTAVAALATMAAEAIGALRDNPHALAGS